MPNLKLITLLTGVALLAAACQQPEDDYPRLSQTALVSNTLDSLGPHNVSTVVRGDAPVLSVRVYFKAEASDTWSSAALSPVSQGPRGLYTGAISPLDVSDAARTWLPGTRIDYYIELVDDDHTERDPASAPDADFYSFFIGPPRSPARLLEITPTRGPTSGRTDVFLYGTGFKTGAVVTFGTTNANNVEVVSGAFIRATTPPGSPGPVDVQITNPDGISTTLTRAFTYEGSPPACTSNADCPNDRVCDRGVCVLPPGCGPGNECPPNSVCDPASGECLPVGCDSRGLPCPPDTQCIDDVCQPLDPCQGVTCDAGFACERGQCVLVDFCAAFPCPDGTRCDAATRTCRALCDGVTCPPSSICEPSTGQCVFRPDCTSNNDCTNGSTCDGEELCVGGTCEGNVPISCDTNNPCVLGICEEPTGNCELQVLPDTTPCPGGTCQNGVCNLSECNVDSDCGDPLACNGFERCVGGTCTTGTPVLCTSSDPCAESFCAEPLGNCQTRPRPEGFDCGNGRICRSGACIAAECLTFSDCDDGLACNGAERCTSAGNCISGTPITCPDDNNPCTAESCSEPSGTCARTPLPEGTDCGNGRTCVSGICTQPPPCTGNSDCDDGNVCNGSETCTSSGTCVDGPVPPDGSLCNTNGNVCLAEACVPPGSCNSNADCDDTNPCTNDTCNSGSCQNANVADFTQCGSSGNIRLCRSGACLPLTCQNDADCDDGLVCNGAETCQFGAVCQPGSALDCSPYVGPCRSGSCNEVAGQCDATPIRDGTVCATTGSCTGGTCSFPPGECRSDADCLPSTPNCNLFTSSCTAPPVTCTTNADCAAGQFCVTAECTDLQGCSNDADCPPGTLCGNQICYLAPNCFSDLDCPVGEQCEGQFCQPTSCSVDADCGANWFCRANRCIPPVYCGQDSDCPLAGLQCINFTCQNPGGCASDAECPANQYCLFGACYFLPPVECTLDADCSPPQFCRFGYCQDP